MIHQLLIIDALNLIRRIYAVQQQRHTDPMQSLHATNIALDNAAFRILQQFNPTHVVAVFDGEQKGWRYQLYPEYKKARKPMPESLSAHMEQLKQVLWQRGIDSLESAADEADDLIATLAYKMADAGHKSCIVSTDLGFCQLLKPNILQYDYFARSFLDEQFVHNKYGLAPSQLCDYWALTGICSLNIKGARGVGPKRSRELLKRFASLSQLLDSINDESNNLGILRGYEKDIRLARQLVELKKTMPLGFSLKEIRFNAING